MRRCMRLLGLNDEPDAQMTRRHDVGLDDLVLEAGEVLGGERQRGLNRPERADVAHLPVENEVGIEALAGVGCGVAAADCLQADVESENAERGRSPRLGRPFRDVAELLVVAGRRWIGPVTGVRERGDGARFQQGVSPEQPCAVRGSLNAETTRSGEVLRRVKPLRRRLPYDLVACCGCEGRQLRARVVG